MSTSIIRHTPWTDDNPALLPLELKVRPYSWARLRGPFLAAELVVCAAVLLAASRDAALGMVAVLGACGIFFHINGLDESILNSRMRDFLIDISQCLALGFLLSGLLLLTLPALASGVAGFLAGAVISGLLPLALRPLLEYLVSRKQLGEGILIVGTGDLAGKLYNTLVNERHSSNGKGKAGAPLEFPFVAARTAVNGQQLAELAARERISRVIVAERSPQRRTELAAALLDSRLRGLRVTDAVDFYETVSGKIWVEGLDVQWLLYTAGFDRTKLTTYLKRCIDVVAATLLILCAAPLMALIAVAIKLGSRGPVVFRQVRVGWHGELFELYKFRSMREDAELETGPVWAAEQDDRITPIGRVLRKFRLDEIPQAFNVLRGEMSLVGPRPERPHFVDMLRERIPFYDLRHYIKPGITGWAQVGYRYGASVDDAYEKLQYDLYYVKHMSLRHDAEILLKTIRTVLFARGH